MDPVPLPIDLPGYYVSEEDLIYLMKSIVMNILPLKPMIKALMGLKLTEQILSFG